MKETKKMKYDEFYAILIQNVDDAYCDSNRYFSDDDKAKIMKELQMVIKQCLFAEYNRKIEKIYEIKELELKKQKEEDEESKR